MNQEQEVQEVKNEQLIITKPQQVYQICEAEHQDKIHAFIAVYLDINLHYIASVAFDGVDNKHIGVTPVSIIKRGKELQSSYMIIVDMQQNYTYNPNEASLYAVQEFLKFGDRHNLPVIDFLVMAKDNLNYATEASYEDYLIN